MRNLAKDAVFERAEIDFLPEISDNGVPYCSTGKCQQYDGKRCKETGIRPSNICEPAVSIMAQIIEETAKNASAN